MYKGYRFKPKSLVTSILIFLSKTRILLISLEFTFWSGRNVYTPVAMKKVEEFVGKGNNSK